MLLETTQPSELTTKPRERRKTGRTTMPLGIASASLSESSGRCSLTKQKSPSNKKSVYQNPCRPRLQGFPSYWASGVQEVQWTSVMHRPKRSGDRTHDSCVQTHELVKKGTTPFGVIPFFTGLAGFEPTSAGVKVLCLTAWR